MYIERNIITLDTIYILCMKGQTTIFLILVILFLIVLFIWKLPIFSFHSSNIIIRRLSWKSDRGEISTAKPGEIVRAEIVISSSSIYSGYITVKVRKDLKFLPDKDVAYLKQYYIMGRNKKITLTLTFRAEKSIFTRGYFIEIEWDGGKYTMERSYPPRLSVSP